MKWKVLHAEMTHREQEGYFGQVQFEVEGHKQPYELTLHSEKRLDDWHYSLHFMQASGSEQEIASVEQAIETDDDFFDQLVEAAVAKLTASGQ